MLLFASSIRKPIRRKGNKTMSTKLYVKTSMFLSQFKNDERGVTAIEYGLIAVAMAALLLLATGDDGFIDNLKDAFDAISTDIGKVTTKYDGS